MKIGVISDTHGLVRPEALAALDGCERILHAGGVGTPAILAALADIAPVAAIRGNVDRGAWAAALPEQRSLEVGDVTLYMLHDHNELSFHPRERGVQVVISGHSHRPVLLEKAGVLYLNPGSAGPRRFKLPVTLALLRIEAGQPAAEIVELNVG